MRLIFLTLILGTKIFASDITQQNAPAEILQAASTEQPNSSAEAEIARLKKTIIDLALPPLENFPPKTHESIQQGIGKVLSKYDIKDIKYALELLPKLLPKLLELYEEEINPNIVTALIIGLDTGLQHNDQNFEEHVEQHDASGHAEPTDTVTTANPGAAAPQQAPTTISPAANTTPATVQPIKYIARRSPNI